MYKKPYILMIGLISVFFLSATAKAETFFAYLSSAQEVPTNASTATGFARVFVNESAGTLTFTVTFTGLSSNQSASHIHAAAAIGTNAGVAINFGAVGGTSGTISGSGTITPTQLAQIRAHMGYVNVHSVNFPGGEIRGQLGIKRPVDFDGDGRMDFSVLRFPATPPQPITYWNRNSTTGTQVVSSWGDAATDFPVPGDYDGDGKDDLAVYRAGATAGAQSSVWVFKSSTNTLQYYAWGTNGDRAVCRDYDGDGMTDVAVVRPGATPTAPLTWYIRNSSNNTVAIITFGATADALNTSGDTPIPGDYDGDGKFDIAVYRFGGLSPSNSFIIQRSSDGVVTYQVFGNFQTDYILPGDYDGDGKYDLAVARTGATATSPMVWWILNSATGTVRVQTFGFTSDLPIQGDYDGDARTDIAVYRPGATGVQSNFWVLNSFNNTASVTPWGVGGDFAVNTFDIR